MKRGEIAPQRKPSRSLKEILQKSDSYVDLPTGLNRAEAIATMRPDELCCLQRRAEAQAASFKVLSDVNVVDLSKVS